MDYYPPVKWAMDKGYITLVKGRLGSTTYFITETGKALLGLP